MMYPETKPIVFCCPKRYETVEIFPVHDLHYGNECFNVRKWDALTDLILSEPNRYVIWVGDLLENAIPNSKSNIFDQTQSPQEQKEYITDMFRKLADRTIAITDGNHEINRSTRNAGLYPLYDCACIAGIPELYRTAYAVLDIGVGGKAHSMDGRQHHYIGFATHRARTLKSFASVDALENFDFFLTGHDHEANDHPRGKLIYDGTHKTVYFKSVEVVNCGSFLSYGGYGAAAGYRPKSDKMYKLVLHGGQKKQIETVGFYI